MHPKTGNWRTLSLQEASVPALSNLSAPAVILAGEMNAQTAR